MKIIFRKLQLNLIIAFFLITLSYSEYGYLHGLLNIKYIGIIIIMYELLIKRIIRNNTIPIRGFQFCVGLVTFFSVSAIFQDLSLSSIIQTIFYAFVLGIIIEFSTNAIKSNEDILAISMGILFGIFFSFVTDETSLIPRGYERLRIYGGFRHPNTFGAASMSVYICILTYLISENQRKFKKFILVIILLLCVIFCILSNSKSAIYGSMIFTLLVGLFYFRNKYNIPQYIYITFILISSLIAGIALLYSFDAQDMYSLEVRLNSLKYINTENLFEFLFGNGLVGLSDNASWGAEFALTSLIIKVGILGMIVFISIIVYLFIRSRKQSQINKNYFSVLLLTFLISCIAESYITNITNIYSMIMWILLSALSNGFNLKSDSCEKRN